MQEHFRRYAAYVAAATGSAWAFILALAVIIVWAATGPLFHYSDTWQLVINTSTTIITFLMVFLIQNTQNRDGKAVQLKLDELIRAVAGARNNLIDLERLTDHELEDLHREFLSMAKANEQGQSSLLAEPAPMHATADAPGVHVVHRVASAVAHELKKRRPHTSDPKK